MSDLKRIAEAMGHEGFSVEDAKAFPCFHIYTTPFWRGRKDLMPSIKFNPEENPAQLLEVLEWLLKKGWNICSYDEIYEMSLDCGEFAVSKRSDDFSKVIMKAAYSQVRKV